MDPQYLEAGDTMLQSGNVPPSVRLASTGYFLPLYAPQGRYWYMDISKSF